MLKASVAMECTSKSMAFSSRAEVGPYIQQQ